MSTNVKSKSLNKSDNFMASKNLRSRTLRSEVKNLLDNSTLENIELEYIKNLQQQVYFLEMECNYLRQQLDLNGLQTSFKYDNKSQQLKNDMRNIQMEKNNLEHSLHEENKQKETVLQMLENTEKTFHQERELLLKEISLLKKQKKDIEENFISKSVELTKSKDNLNKHHLDSHETEQHIQKIENQLDSVRKDNLHLRTELNEARTQLISRDNLIKDLQHQLVDPTFKKSNELKSSISNISNKLNQTNDALTKEAVNSKLVTAFILKLIKLQDQIEYLKLENENLKYKLSESTREKNRLSTSLEASLKQNEADLILAKKNVDLSKGNFQKLHNDLENEKATNTSLIAQIDQFKLQERLEIKNQIILKKRIKDLEEIALSHESQKEASLKKVKDQLKNKQLEFENEQNKLAHDLNGVLSSKKHLELKINELNEQIEKLHLKNRTDTEVNRSKLNHLNSQLDESSSNLHFEKQMNASLNLKIDNLVRQDEIYNNLISSLKRRISELEAMNANHNQKNWLIFR